MLLAILAIYQQATVATALIGTAVFSVDWHSRGTVGGQLFGSAQRDSRSGVLITGANASAIAWPDEFVATLASGGSFVIPTLTPGTKEILGRSRMPLVRLPPRRQREPCRAFPS